MPNTPAYDDLYKRLAATVAGNKRGGGYAQFAQGIKPIQNVVQSQEQRQSDWNAGQGLIDALSTGSYAVAGIGKKIGENFAAVNRGDMGGLLDLANPFSLVTGAGRGIAERRTWSDNLKDLGVAEGEAAGYGLALDIALDPFWLIPGGAVAAGVKGTARGIGVASAASRAGAKLSKPTFAKAAEITKDFAVKSPMRNVAFAKGEATGPVSELFQTGQKISPLSQQGISNFVQGIRQGNVEQYAEWSAARVAKKQLKAARKEAKATSTAPIEFNPFDVLAGGVATSVAKAAERTADNAGNAAEKATSAVNDVIENAVSKQKTPDTVKDASAVKETIENATDAPSINTVSRETLSAVRKEYLDARGISAPEIDFKAIKASDKAPEMAQVYSKLVNDPFNPEVQKAYRQLVSEVDDQYRFLTEEKGLKIDYINDEPYLNADGVVDSKLMMQDILENNHMFVRNSEPDYVQFGAHPALSVEENNKFRAVHDYFGHATSGRGFAADGEEAAWVTHSVMFSPLARRAMTTETRGQNSYYNFFDPENKQFAEQKAALFPEEYVITPLEEAALAARSDDILATNSYIGRTANLLVDFADRMIDDLGMIATPLKGVKKYEAAELATIKDKISGLIDQGVHAPTSPETKEVVRLLNLLQSGINEPIATRYAKSAVTLAETETMGTRVANIKNLYELAQEAFGAETNTVLSTRALAILKQVLDEPLDATPLLESSLKAAGRTIKQPTSFSPTVWGLKKGQKAYGAPALSLAQLEKYFPDDELLSNKVKLAFALGKPVKESFGADRAFGNQKAIWDEFRARNHDRIKEVEQLERQDWVAANSVPNSDLFIVTRDGQPLGQGLVPDSIPGGTIVAQNGVPRTTLGILIERLGKVIDRAPVGGVELDKYPVELQKWMSGELSKAIKKVKENGVTDARVKQTDQEQLAQRIFDTVPEVKTFSDARILAAGGVDALKELAKQPKVRYYLEGPVDARSGRPDTSQIGRALSLKGKRQEVQTVYRDPETGVPLDNMGNPVPEVKAEPRGDGMPQYRITTDENKPFTGRSKGVWAPQTGQGPQQLGILQAVRESIAAINTGISKKELTVSPQHASLLTSVMTMMGIKVAPEATPNQVFKMFNEQAAVRFEDVVTGLQAAAKTESVTYQLKSIFAASQRENIDLMTAIERLNVDELQTQAVKFTDDAIALVDEACSVKYSKIGVQDLVGKVIKPLG